MVTNTNPDAVNHTFSYLALGDSYTIGEGVDASARWPVQLTGLLRQAGIDVAEPAIVAQTGWTTNELRDAIQNSGSHSTYDLVSLLIGVNNQYRGRSRNRYRTELRQLLKTAVSFANGKSERVFVLSIPDWSVTPFAKRRNRAKITSEIDAFNAIAQEECWEAGIAYVDITFLSRQAADESTAPADRTGVNSQFASDGLHYSGEQMRKWAELTLPVVIDLLRKP